MAVSPSAEAPLLSIEGLSVYYQQFRALHGIDIAVGQGEIVSIIGANGAGKSSLLKAIVSQVDRIEGRIQFAGAHIANQPTPAIVASGIALVPEGRRLFPSLTVEENLGVAARPGRWTVERVYDLFPKLAERRGHWGNQISGGEQQMLAIGRALMGNPTLLLMDEPLEGLAPIIVEVLLQALQRLIREDSLAVVLVEQHAKVALGITQSALVLNRGRIAYTGPSADLLADPQRLTSLVVA